jgi:hypothetical protein
MAFATALRATENHHILRDDFIEAIACGIGDCRRQNRNSQAACLHA